MTCKCKCGGEKAEHEASAEKNMAFVKWICATALVLGVIVGLAAVSINYFTGSYEMPPLLFLFFSVIAAFGATNRMRK